MLKDYEAAQRRKTERIRSVIAYIFGGLLILIGLYLLTYRSLGLTLVQREPSSFDLFIGIVFILYGTWRIYKGYKTYKEQ